MVKVPTYITALKQFAAGDIVTIFTPDDTHFAIAMAAISHGCHVLIAKPAVKTLAHHRALMQHAKERTSVSVLVVDLHLLVSLTLLPDDG